jgi:hypothetical protein
LHQQSFRTVQHIHQSRQRPDIVVVPAPALYCILENDRKKVTGFMKAELNTQKSKATWPEIDLNVSFSEVGGLLISSANR